MKTQFNITDWIKQKLENEKDTIDKIKNKLIAGWEDIKLQLAEMKDDSHHMVPIINGLMGDNMAEKGSNVLVNLSFRYKSRDIEVDDLKKYYNFSEYDGKIILFIHGLMNDESIWQSDFTDTKKRLGTALEVQDDAVCLYIRYNTGLHISENGRAVNNLLQQFVEKYSNEVRELIIISHSMGGLVTRSAGYYADIQGLKWITLLKKVFLIGVPNEGSYLARVAYLTQYFFRKIDITQNDSIAKFFDIRSNGIKDLSFGYLVDEDWQNAEDGKIRNVNVTIVTPLPKVKYYLIAGAVLDEQGRGRIFTFFGDGLVEKESALSRLFKNNSLKSGKVEMKLFNGENHLTLLESKKVHEYVLSCLK